MEDARLGPYQLRRELGSGGMGKVYRAEVTGTVSGLEPGHAVAVKVIHAHLLETPGFFKRFLREADLGRAIEHENVVRTYDCDALLHDGVQQNFLVMEYVEGQTLRDLLQELERVPEELCRHIGREVAKGLAAIHEAGVVHRDLKPENVLITPEHVVKIMDLGVARLQAEAIRLSQTGAFVGSLEYAAPEQFRSSMGEPDGRADLHALGVLLYELSTGHHPYRDEDAAKVLRNILDDSPRRIGEINPQLSPFFEEVVHTLIAKDRDARFGSSPELAAVLEEGEDSAWWKERARVLRVETKRPLRRIRIPRETALYGRDDDLARLRTAYDSSTAGDGQVLLIEGEAGIGKTRLVDEFVGRLREQGEDVNFLFGSYPPGGAATAAGAFSTAYREHFGSEGLEDTLESYLKPTPILIPAFAALLRGETTPAGTEALTKDSLQTVFVHATRALAAERTTIVVIDDLHFAPEDGRALFSSLAMAVPEHRILLIGTMRPGVPEEWSSGITRLEHAEHTNLARLGAKDLTRLLRDAFRSEKLATDLGFRIAEKSDGNPFFAFEIIRGLREGQFIAQQPDGTWASTKVIQNILVPSSVLDLVQARIGDLSPEERDFLDIAACYGFEFEPDLLAAVAGSGRIPTLKCLAQIERKHRLVRTSGRNFVFDHHQVQEAIYGSLPLMLREEYHGAIGAALEARAGTEGKDATGVDGALCVDLCEHFLRSTEPSRAAPYLEAAQAHLTSSFLHTQMVSLTRRALQTASVLRDAERVGALSQLAGALDHLGRRAEQVEAAREAVATAQRTEDARLQAKAYGLLGYALEVSGDYAAATTVFERSRVSAQEAGAWELEARAIVGLSRGLIVRGRVGEARRNYEALLAAGETKGRPWDEGDAAANLGYSLLQQGRYDEALRYYERGHVLSRDRGDRRREAQSLLNLSDALRNLGRLEEAARRIEACMTAAREIGSRPMEAHARSMQGVIATLQGDFEKGREHLRGALSLYRLMGDRRGESTSLTNLGALLLNSGRYRDAREPLERALRLSREMGYVRGQSLARRNLALVLTKAGRYDQALEHLEQQRALTQDAGDVEGEVHAAGALGSVYVGLGQLQNARDEFERGLALSRQAGLQSSEVVDAVNLGLVFTALGARDVARAHLEACLEQCHAIGDRRVESYALDRLGTLAEAAGEWADAQHRYEEALSLRRAIQYPSGIAHTAGALGGVLLRRGHPEEARPLLEEASRLGVENTDYVATLLAACWSGLLPDADPVAIGAVWDECAHRVDHLTRMRAAHLLWEATRNPVHLTEAKRLLDHLVEHAPEAYRESMLSEVRLHREIMEAWVEHQEPAPE